MDRPHSLHTWHVMLLPIAHEHATVGKLPWVTFTIILLCLVSQLQVASSESAMADSEHRFIAAIDYFAEHPYLDPDPRLLPPSIKGLYDQDLLARVAREQPGLAQQSRLDDLTEDWLDSLHSHPLWRDGLVPETFTWASLLSHLFLHAGWLHLLGNMLFLYLTGPYVEDAWGHWVFAPFYLAAGFAAAGGFCLRYPELFRPLVGASGAVAGVMGAFLVLHFRTRIRFVYWFGILVGTFRAPAWVMLPLWFVGELGAAMAIDRAMPGGVAGGVAYWAHVFGFLFGLTVAVGLRQLGLGRLAPQTSDDSGRTAEGSDRALTGALAAQRHGRPEEALVLLHRAVRDGSASLDARAMHWELACELGRARDVAPDAARLIRAEVDAKRLDQALGHYRKLTTTAPEGVDLGLAVKLAEGVAARDRLDDARALLEQAAGLLEPHSPIGPVVRLVRLLSDCDRHLLRRVTPVLLANPELPGELREELELSHLA